MSRKSAASKKNTPKKKLEEAEEVEVPVNEPTTFTKQEQDAIIQAVSPIIAERNKKRVKKFNEWEENKAKSQPAKKTSGRVSKPKTTTAARKTRATTTKAAATVKATKPAASKKTPAAQKIAAKAAPKKAAPKKTAAKK